jgi:eukaryotic-like serine/threonine-protein kinase
MNAQAEIALCPECGRPIPTAAPEGLCPACLALAAVDEPAADPVHTPPDQPFANLRFYGDYELIRELGRGAMGVVHLAHQLGVNRPVALKLLAGGAAAGRDFIHRFHTEAATAARLDHPGIVPVYEFGTHDGAYYLAMKYLEGGTLADRLKAGLLEPPEIARIMIRIAQAVHHAHQHGVLHRDLKPGNILLDTDGQPCVADFGLARLLETDSTLTLSSAIVGTAAYLAPEIARGGASQATTASDIYGLGAIFYELLTGHPPFTGASLADILRKVQEEEPCLPKSEIRNQKSEMGRGISDLGFMISDLETICLKCLEKEPAKRYPTAQALADDLERFLNDEPILARPVTRLERAWRWCRRKPALAAAYGLLLLLLLLLSIASPIAAYRINDARRQATEEADTARAILAFLRDDLLSVADPFAGNTERPRGRNLTLLAAVDLAARNVRQRFPDQPLVEAGIRLTLWQVYFALGDLEQAEEHINRASELYDRTPDAPELERLKALESMAWMHHARGRYEEATGLIEPVLDRRTRLQGANHPDVLGAQRCRLAILTSSNRHPEAMALGEDLLERARQLPVEQTEVLLRIMGDVSWVWYRQGEFRPCYELSEEAFHIAHDRFGTDHALTIELMGDWAKWLRLQLGRFHEAEPLQQEAYDRGRELFGADHALTLDSLSELALLADAKGLFGRRMEIQEQLVPLSQQAFGPDSPNAMFEQMRLAWGRLEEGRPEDAEALLADALDRLRETRGSDDFLTRRALRWLPGVLATQGRFDEALDLRREAMESHRRVLGHNALWTHFTTYHLANLHARIGQWPQAGNLYLEFLPSFEFEKTGRQEHKLYSAAVAAAHLAGDSVAAGTFTELTLRRAQSATHRRARLDLTVALLLATDSVSQGSPIHTLASETLANIPAPRRDPLLPGLLALRRQDFEQASRLLVPVYRPPTHPSAGLACAVGAIAEHWLGNTAKAIHLLLNARDRLERVSRAGDLGHTVWYPYEEWLPVAQLALACREAETLIHGESLQPILDENTLANARLRWLPVKSLLDEVDRAAIRADWPTALERLSAAIGHEYFDWSAAMQSREQFAAKAAVLLAFGGELSVHPELQERILNSGVRRASAVLLLHPDSLPARTLDSVIAAARFAAEDHPATTDGNPWSSLELGLAELRDGNPRAALLALEPAAGAYNLRCTGAAHAVAALALRQLGEHDSARQRLAQARDAFDQLTDGNRQSLGPNWHEMLFLELGIQKATELLNNEG